ncbi:MAG: ABC transporter permease [Actinobacteria bacterium]|nr:ABC transporter permease [Actinomycetota bacterium]
MRVPVARRNLFSDLTRLGISVGGVAIAILLMLTLLGIYKGTLDQSTSYVNNVGADLWVAQAGAKDMFHTFSIVPLSLADEISLIDGVSEVHPLISRPTLVPIGGRENTMTVVGYHTGTGVGGPWDIAEGRAPPGPGEIVLDRSIMKQNGLKLNDSIDLEGVPHKIVGVSRGTTLIINPYAFIDLEEAGKFLGPGRVSFLMVKLNDPARAQQVSNEIADSHPELAVFSREKFAENNASVIREAFLPILAVLVVIAFAAGVAIVGLVVYSATIERYREYGILKAVGAGSRNLYGIVFKQSVISSLIGFLVGSAASFGVAWIVMQAVAKISVSFSWIHFASALLAALSMSVLASYIPIRKINKIDPMIVFKA